MSVAALRLVDLRACDHTAMREALGGFITMYSRTFTDPSEREDPSQWYDRLLGEYPAPQPITHLLVAMDDTPSRDTIVGGLVFEYYRTSRAGLLTYLTVDIAYRRRHLARQLVEQAIEILRRDAIRHGEVLRAVFGEVEDPRKVGSRGNAMSPRDRLTVMARLGARQVDIQYVQPALAGGAGRCSHLLLLAVPLDFPGNGHIDGDAVRDFLHEFYRALGITHPDADADFIAISHHITKSLPLKEL